MINFEYIMCKKKDFVFYLCLVCTFIVATSVYAQPPTRYTSFTRVYSGNGTTVGKGVCVDYMQNIYVAGIRSDVVSATSTDAFLIKLDSTALKVKWRVTTTNIGVDEYTTVKYSAIDSTIVVAGFTNSNTVNNNYQGVVAKYKTNGTLVWSTTIGGADLDVLNDCVINTNGDIYLTGNTTSNTNAGVDVWLIKLNAQGTTLINKNYGNAFDDSANGIALLHDTVFVVGTTTNITNDNNYYLLALNTFGDTLYSSTWGSATANEELLKCAVGNDALHVTGMSTFNNDNNPYNALLNTSNGSKRWEYIYPTSPTINDEGICTVYFDYNKLWAQLIITQTFGYAGTKDFFLKVSDTNGNIIAGSSSGYKYDDVYYNACQVNDSCLIAVGTSDSYLKNGYTNLILRKQNIYTGGSENADSVNAITPRTVTSTQLTTYVTPTELTIVSTIKVLGNITTINAINILGQQVQLPIIKSYSQSVTCSIAQLNVGIYYTYITLIDGEQVLIKFAKNE